MKMVILHKKDDVHKIIVKNLINKMIIKINIDEKKNNNKRN